MMYPFWRPYLKCGRVDVGVASSACVLHGLQNHGVADDTAHNQQDEVDEDNTSQHTVCLHFRSSHSTQSDDPWHPDTHDVDSGCVAVEPIFQWGCLTTRLHVTLKTETKI